MTAELDTGTELPETDATNPILTEASEADGHKQLAFSFAKRHKVLVDTGETPAVVYHTDSTDFCFLGDSP